MGVSGAQQTCVRDELQRVSAVSDTGGLQGTAVPTQMVALYSAGTRTASAGVHAVARTDLDRGQQHTGHPSAGHQGEPHCLHSGHRLEHTAQLQSRHVVPLPERYHEQETTAHQGLLLR